MKHLGLIPLRNFACLNYSFGVFRSAQPQYSYEYKWLKDVADIDVIINLRAESRHDERMVQEFGLKVINFDIKDHQPPTFEQAEKFLSTINDIVLKEGKKVLIHCEHGHGRTSTFSVLAGLALGGSLENLLDEERTKFHYHFKHHVQEQFLRDFASKALVKA